MATISIPAGGVDLANVAVRPTLYQAGAAVTTGLIVYSDATDLDSNGNGKVKATDVTTEAGATAVGMVLQDAADDGGAVVLTNGCVVTNLTLTKGSWYVADNSGTLAEYSDLTGSTDYVTFFGYCNESGDLVIDIIVTGNLKS